MRKQDVISIVLVGGGEHARVLVDSIRELDTEYRIRGYVDQQHRDSLPGVDYLGPDSTLVDLESVVAILAIGATKSSGHRRAVAERLSPHIDAWATVVHPSVSMSGQATVGAGSTVLAGAITQAGVRIGRHAIVNTGVILDHDSVVEDYAIVSPGAVVGGGVHIGEQAFIGLGAHIRDHVSIGSGATVAMGAVVTASVASDSTVMGVPAREQS